jgi:phosphatidylinositol 4-kinase
MQLIEFVSGVFTDAQLPLKLRPYSVLVTSPTSGLIETVPNSTSVHTLKEKAPNFESLLTFFVDLYGPTSSAPFRKARANFVESMAAYSIVSYIFQIKDRHNGNLLLDAEGHLIHIDFGFMFSNSPGGNMNFESSPFKLTSEFVEVMGAEFSYFKMLFIRGFLELRKHAHKLLLLVEVMYRDHLHMPCFLGSRALSDLEARFKLKEDGEKVVEHAVSLIDESLDNWRTNQYDSFQKITNGIL